MQITGEALKMQKNALKMQEICNQSQDKSAAFVTREIENLHSEPKFSCISAV